MLWDAIDSKRIWRHRSKVCKKEFGHSVFKINKKINLFNGCNNNLKQCSVWMSHADKVDKLPKGFIAVGVAQTQKLQRFTLVK